MMKCYQEEGMNYRLNSKRTKDSIIDNFMPRTYIKSTRALKDLNVNYLEGQTHNRGYLLDLRYIKRAHLQLLPWGGGVFA